jgi:hypothetical protein
VERKLYWFASPPFRQDLRKLKVLKVRFCNPKSKTENICFGF